MAKPFGDLDWEYEADVLDVITASDRMYKNCEMH